MPYREGEREREIELDKRQRQLETNQIACGTWINRRSLKAAAKLLLRSGSSKAKRGNWSKSSSHSSLGRNTRSPELALFVCIREVESVKAAVLATGR